MAMCIINAENLSKYVW